MVGSFRQRLSSLPDKRTGKNTRYGMEDAALSAFSVFFTQTPSFLAYQRMMEGSKGHSNAQSLFGVHQIPSDNQIRALLDGVKPEQVFPIFEEILQVLEQQGQLKRLRSFADTLLMAIDGTEYFGSSQIHCPQCSTRQLKSGEMYYFHSVVTPVIVCPGQSQVIPLVPEFVVPQDGHDKQDCENAAAKRWFLQYGQRYRAFNVTVLGDDLYCHQPLCQQLLAQQFDFILVCRPESHATLYEHLEGIDLPTVTTKRWTGKVEETYTYRYLNDVPLKDGDDALLVNWCELTVSRPDGKVVYKNSFATNHPITDDTVAEVVLAGRTRWKVENENNNTLKTKGYNLEHNFGHGKQHLASFLATLNILSLLFHTLLELLDQKYKLLRSHLPTRKTFFDDLRALTRYLYFNNWDHLLTFMLEGLELEIPPNTS
ncbi:transposase [Leptolyngbya sp. NK1-12]|uniref:Transposase n=1 Tax=Leptolyngbya sp. NK1-12 TaxID=2547451 RepID=A0AA97AKZ1_9CYAN|nr:transposase [Leptolyngbya sp. NK1-12]WNZ26377.1 transposase [Leptolyngbya sp. NK1-12]WNZ26733.1 transposase [Leptolyngbya sp. NK1-12]WNZ26798.1 transposase [Leptolyngbya sp. NK1-12]WNZ26809.1 transposase [Leptolyngbya sp. NK1-12]WNZ26821.1 transposase [Leptolyngbya sp. NK1-12]